MLETKEYLTIGDETIKLGFVLEMLLRPDWHLVYSPKLPVLGFLVRKLVLRFRAGLIKDGDFVLLISNLFVI